MAFSDPATSGACAATTSNAIEAIGTEFPGRADFDWASGRPAWPDSGGDAPKLKWSKARRLAGTSNDRRPVIRDRHAKQTLAAARSAWRRSMWNGHALKRAHCACAYADNPALRSTIDNVPCLFKIAPATFAGLKEASPSGLAPRAIWA